MDIYQILKESLNLKYKPVGIELIYKNQEIKQLNTSFKEPKKMQRYCEFVKKAAQGEWLKLKKGVFSCVTAEILLGFKKPEYVEMPLRLNVENLEYILLFPIDNNVPNEIDSILLIINPKMCMDIIEAYNKVFNKPLNVSFGQLTGICGEVTADVIKNKDLRISFLCSGSRIFANFDDCELLCGIPREMINSLVKELEIIAKDRKADEELMKQLKNYD